MGSISKKFKYIWIILDPYYGNRLFYSKEEAWHFYNDIEQKASQCNEWKYFASVSSPLRYELNLDNV